MQFNVLCEVMREHENIFVYDGQRIGKATVTNLLIGGSVKVGKISDFYR
jgi:hypothetical protein